MPGLTPKTKSFVLFQICRLGQLCQIQSFEYRFSALYINIDFSHVVTLQFKTRGFVWGSQGKVEICFKNHLFLVQSTACSTNLSWRKIPDPNITFSLHETSSDKLLDSDILKVHKCWTSPVITAIFHANPPLWCSSVSVYVLRGFKDGNLLQKSVLTSLLWCVAILWKVKCQWNGLMLVWILVWYS